MIWESQIPLPRRPFAKIIFKMGAKIFFERAKIFWNRAKIFSKVQNFFQKYFFARAQKIFLKNLFFTRAIWTGGWRDAKILNYFWEKYFCTRKKFLCARKKIIFAKIFLKNILKNRVFFKNLRNEKKRLEKPHPFTTPSKLNKNIYFRAFLEFWNFEIAGKIFYF